MNQNHPKQPTTELMDKAIERAAQTLTLPTPPSIGHQTQAIFEKIAQQESSQSKPFSFPRWLLPAMVPAIVLLAALFFWPRTQPLQFANAPGSQQTIFLPDGSEIELHGASSIKLEKGFGHTLRELTLTGEAFFRVAKAEHAFKIQIGDDLVVTVLGTQFNIKQTPQEVVVSVTEGKVATQSQSSSGPPQSVTLTAGQSCRYTKDIGFEGIKPLPQGTWPLWKYGIFVFEKTPLQSVVLELENHFDIQIQLSDHQKQLKISGRIQTRDPDTALKLLARLASLEWEKDNNSYRLK